MRSTKGHVTIARRESKSRDRHASESEKWLAKHYVTIARRECVSRDDHVIAVRRKWTSRVGVQILERTVPG